MTHYTFNESCFRPTADPRWASAVGPSLDVSVAAAGLRQGPQVASASDTFFKAGKKPFFFCATKNVQLAAAALHPGPQVAPAFNT